MPTPRIKIGIKHLNSGKSSKYGFILRHFYDLMFLFDGEIVGMSKEETEKQKQKICEEYKWKFNFCRNWTNDQVWEHIKKSYFEYWDYLHYDKTEQAKALIKNS